MGRIKDLTSKVFGKLTVISFHSKNDKGTYRGTLWNCICDCGSLVVCRSDTLIKGSKKSCGCLSKKPYGESSYNYLFDKYQRGAKARNLPFCLSSEDFRKMTKLNCHYCGEPPSTICTTASYYGKYVYNGLDRKDNSKGYTLDNVVPCCSVCNKMKNTMDYFEFMKHISKIQANLV